MLMNLEHVDGENKGNILLFALSTCGWCAKTRKLLEELKELIEEKFSPRLVAAGRKKKADI